MTQAAILFGAAVRPLNRPSRFHLRLIRVCLITDAVSAVSISSACCHSKTAALFAVFVAAVDDDVRCAGRAAVGGNCVAVGRAAWGCYMAMSASGATNFSSDVSFIYASGYYGIGY